MSQASTDPDAPTALQPAADGGSAPGSGRAGRTLIITVLAGVVPLVAVAMVISLLSDGPQAAFSPDGERLGPVSGTEQTPLPDGTLLAFHSDDPVEVRDYVGRPLVVNFWASWCAPCVEEMPDFQEVADELEGTVTFLGVNAQDSAEKAREFATDLGIGFELVRDPTASYFSTVGGFGWPTTLLVDEDGFIRYRHTGPLDADQLRGLLETHLLEQHLGHSPSLSTARPMADRHSAYYAI